MKAWEDFLLLQEQELGAETVKKWLRTLKIVRFDAGNLFLEAKDSFQVIWFEEHIKPKLGGQLLNNNHRKIKVHLSIGSRDAPNHKEPATSSKKLPPAAPAFQLSFDQIDPSAIFENFVPLPSNHIPFTLLKDNLYGFNPIYLWGGTGSGKTHLLMSIAADNIQCGKKVIYARTETFTDHVVSAIRSGEMGRFRQTYRNADILLLDNVHLFSRKSATQEELFHTFNALHLMGKQIILAAKCPPSELQEIEPRLVSRFEWGIVLSIDSANDQEMHAILKKKAAVLDYPLPAKVADFLIDSFKSSPKAAVRALEALILRSHIQDKQQLLYKPMTVQLANHYLSDLLLAEKQSALTPEKIIHCASEHYGIRPEDILGKAQSRDVAQPRQIAMYLCRRHLELSFPEIGNVFGRDHSTVMSSVKLVQKSIDARDSGWCTALTTIEKKMGR